MSVRIASALSGVFFRFPQHCFLDFHVSELVRVKYLATIQTFNVFDVLFTRYDAHFGVFAGGVHLGGLVCKPVLLGKIVPAGFRLSNLFLRFPRRQAKFYRNQRPYLGMLPTRFRLTPLQPESSPTVRTGSGLIPISSSLPKIILPEAVCNTLVTVISTARPIIRRAWSITTMVPSSR
jgi:hypothetical protein